MSDAVLVAIVSGIVTLMGYIGTNSLIRYRVGELEKKVEKHNNFIVRLSQNEQLDAVQCEQIAQLKCDIAEIRCVQR